MNRVTSLTVPENRNVELLTQAFVAFATSEEYSLEAYTVFFTWESEDPRLAGQVAYLGDRILSELGSRVAVQLANDLSVFIRRPRVFNNFFVDGLEAFKAIYNSISPDFFSFNGFYMVVVIGEFPLFEQQSMTGEILRLMWKLYVVNVHVLFSEPKQGFVLSYTFFPFTVKFCEQVEPTVWNIYFNGRFLSNRKHFPSKLTNLHQCPLHVPVYTYSAFMQLEHDVQGHLTRVFGVDVRLLRYLSRKLNFSYVFHEVPDNLRFGLIYENGTATGAMQMVISGRANFTLGYFGYNYLRHRYMSLSQNYYYSMLVMVVSPGANYEAFEKLLLPFNNPLWLAFLLCLLSALAIIFCIERFPALVKDFVFGRSIHNPSLNLFNVLFGGSSYKLPGRNFARYLLMMWILYCLILRTIYQQALFNFLQQSPIHLAAATLPKFIESNLPVYVIPSEVYVFNQMPELRQRLRIIPTSKIDTYDTALRQGKLQGGRLSNYEKVLFDNSQLKDRYYYLMLKQQLANYPICVGLRLNSCLTKPFDDAILRLESTGLTQAWVKKFVDRKYGTVREASTDEPRKITLVQLLGAFQVWLIGLGLAVVSFALECVWVNFNNMCTLH
ncbi:uncharacterized protein LOC129758007 [Uranotaenia lowii]|uniref:uncharacterized protein LOC129758007 n=1 Tax=Uranotaenia lowii TaxID=190385 RepID=UPI002479E55B|nr:uncharacterized protein LOC129758007 [Uranotaenia lowii]